MCTEGAAEAKNFESEKVCVSESEEKRRNKLRVLRMK